MTIEVMVKGMTCGGCVRSVSNAIVKATPGATVAVDLPTGQVKVDGTDDRAAVVKAVEAAGFEVTA